MAVPRHRARVTNSRFVKVQQSSVRSSQPVFRIESSVVHLQTVTMAEFSRFAVLLIVGALILMGGTAIVTGADAPADNVATQWSYLYTVIACEQLTAAYLPEPNVIFAQLHLAQWHALLALKNTGACTTQEVVVAYASHKIMSNYFPLHQVGLIDPLLNTQLKKLRVSDSVQKLGKQLGEAVALDLIAKRRTAAREFALKAVKDALDAEAKSPRPGVYRYLNNTPAGRDAAFFIFHNIPIAQPYVIPEPSVFIKAFLRELKPPKVPSDEWDKEYDKVKDVGRADWPGRTREMNDTANNGCTKVNSLVCFPEEIWATVARATIPKGTSLYDTVSLFAKLSVAMHDTLIVLTTLQYGFRFWRPEMAFPAGDPRHSPIPNWTPYLKTPLHTEYPSGTVSSYSAGATILEDLIGKDVPFTMPGGGVFGLDCPTQGPIPAVKFSSFSDLVKYGQRARVYAGAHYYKSVEDGVKVGARVARYVEANWGVGTPSGVLPNPTYLKVFAELPKVQTSFSPIKLVY